MWREEAHSQRGSRELLSRPERTQRAGGDGSDGARAVVRALTGGAELRAVDWRSGGDSGQASAGAEERPSGCGTSIAVTGGGSISADLGAESGKSRSAATALAPASAGAEAGTSQEPGAGDCPGRRNKTQERIVGEAGADATWVAIVGSL